MNLRPQQNGMVLLISLILLLLLTLIAIAAAHQASLQVRMSANSQQQNIAFQAAESGITDIIGSIEIRDTILYDAQYGNTPTYNLFTKQLTTTSNYTIEKSQPIICMDQSLGAGFSYSCYNIESTGQSCADANCNNSDNPAKAHHRQGVLVRTLN